MPRPVCSGYRQMTVDCRSDPEDVMALLRDSFDFRRCPVGDQNKLASPWVSIGSLHNRRAQVSVGRLAGMRKSLREAQFDWLRQWPFFIGYQSSTFGRTYPHKHLCRRLT